MEPAIQSVARRVEATIRVGRSWRACRRKQRAQQSHSIGNVDVSVISHIRCIEAVHRLCQKQVAESFHGIRHIDGTIRIGITADKHPARWCPHAIRILQVDESITIIIPAVITDFKIRSTSAVRITTVGQTIRIVILPITAIRFPGGGPGTVKEDLRSRKTEIRKTDTTTSKGNPGDPHDLVHRRIRKINLYSTRIAGVREKQNTAAKVRIKNPALDKVDLTHNGCWRQQP